MPQLFDHQIEGAEFLASRRAALLADAPRVGKTGAAIRACDYTFARSILVITTATGRAQWGRELRVWGHPRKIHVQYGAAAPLPADAEAVVVGWHEFFKEPLFSQLVARRWDVILPDEAHYACNVMNSDKPTRRTIALYGRYGLKPRAEHVWPLTGTPMPNGAPDDLFPMLRSLAPQRLLPFAEYDKFIARYCVTKSRWVAGRHYTTVVGGKNLDELNDKLKGFWLRRTQQDVGIKPPIFSLFPLHVDKLPPELADNPDAQAIFDAAETGSTRQLEMHLGPLRRLTGTIKAHAVVDAVREQFAFSGLDKIVLMSWHSDVIDIIAKGLSAYGVVGIDGRTPPTKRDSQVRAFQTDPLKRVFNGQLQAAGEAIDLSAAAELWIVEPSFLPKDMAQGALRITNHSQKRQALVRVCALAGSLDETLMAILTRKVETIHQTLEN